jgi:hypothetical protein
VKIVITQITTASLVALFNTTNQNHRQVIRIVANIPTLEADLKISFI